MSASGYRTFTRWSFIKAESRGSQPEESEAPSASSSNEEDDDDRKGKGQLSDSEEPDSENDDRYSGAGFFTLERDSVSLRSSGNDPQTPSLSIHSNVSLPQTASLSPQAASLSIHSNGSEADSNENDSLDDIENHTYYADNDLCRGFAKLWSEDFNTEFNSDAKSEVSGYETESEWNTTEINPEAAAAAIHNILELNGFSAYGDEISRIQQQTDFLNRQGVDLKDDVATMSVVITTDRRDVASEFAKNYHNFLEGSGYFSDGLVFREASVDNDCCDFLENALSTDGSHVSIYAEADGQSHSKEYAPGGANYSFEGFALYCSSLPSCNTCCNGFSAKCELPKHGGTLFVFGTERLCVVGKRHLATAIQKHQEVVFIIASKNDPEFLGEVEDRFPLKIRLDSFELMTRAGRTRRYHECDRRSIPWSLRTGGRARRSIYTNLRTQNCEGNAKK
jgi:hypothetical protein